MYGLDRYIYINENSLSKEMCEEIINKYNDDETNKLPGRTKGGIISIIKDTMDYVIDHKNIKWKKIRDYLIRELISNLNIYISKLDTPMYKSQLNTIDNPKIKNNFTELYINDLLFETLMVQKYEANKGRYIYHNDGTCEPGQFRVVTYIWYLNDVIEGGETLFWDNYKIKPQAGKLVLFPATWTYPHSGLMPTSNDKYIITGWIYQKIDYNNENEQKQHQSQITQNVSITNRFLQRTNIKKFIESNICNWLINVLCNDEKKWKNNKKTPTFPENYIDMFDIFNMNTISTATATATANKENNEMCSFIKIILESICDEINKSYVIENKKTEITHVLVTKYDKYTTNETSMYSDNNRNITVEIMLSKLPEYKNNQEGLLIFDDGLGTYLNQGDMVIYSNLINHCITKILLENYVLYKMTIYMRVV